MFATLLLIGLFILLMGALPVWSYSRRGWGWWFASAVFAANIVLAAILAAMGRLT